jgi:siroheme synthase-like protein
VSSQRYYVACVDLSGRDVLVVGGGRVALEKVQGVLECAARVTVVAPEVDDELRALDVHVIERRFEREDVAGRWLVLAATDDRDVNRAVSEAAADAQILCNVADDPELCTFILPALVRRDPIVVAVSTGGASPALAQRLRDEIGAVVGSEHAELAERLQALRPWAKRALPTYEARRDYFARLVEEALAGRTLAGAAHEAETSALSAREQR